jgi:hypothetical protein
VEANPYSIAIVAEDKGAGFPTWSGSNVPPYTAQQVESLIFILGWICARYGLPASSIRTSLPDEPHGIGWHRLGIDGNFPTSWAYWGRQPGGQHWSNTTGKACPGDNRIRQLTEQIVPAVADELGQGGDVRPDPDARYLPFEFSKVTGSSGTPVSVTTTTTTSRKSSTQEIVTIDARALGEVNGGTLQTASLVAEASGGVIGSIPWKTGGGHYGTAWDVVPGGWGGPNNPDNERCVGAVFTATGNGYWLVSDKGGVFTFGDARPFTGSVWGKNVVGAKRNSVGALVVVLADGTEVPG